jgi:signal transduction histidine kinase
MKAEWSLPVASGVQRNNLVGCNDSLHPAVIFGTYSPSQGIADEYFDDSYSYLTKVNSNGDIVFHKLTGITFESTRIIEGENASTFYVAHSLPFMDPSEADMSLKPRYAISEIDQDGNVIKSTPLEQPVICIWRADYKLDGNEDIYVKLHDGTIKIFDPGLNLLAESDNSFPGNYLGNTKIAGESQPVMIFSDSGLTVYSHRFKKLASAGLEGGFAYFEELVPDQQGNTAEFIAGGGNRFFIAGITHLNTPQLMNIYIAEYRYYLLGIALTMLVILIAMNIYRAKMKRSLVLITRQKDEIEDTHEQLKKAYRELEIASETIAAQREREAAASQYRIASAQFRHEINNALGAVKLFVSNAIQKIAASGGKNRFEERYNRLSKELTDLMERLPELDPQMRERLAEALNDMKDIDQKLLNGLEEIVLRGVNRGLSLSEKLRRFERIDYDEVMEEVDLNQVIDLALREYSPHIEQSGIAIKRKMDGDATIKGSGQLFEIMFRNLLDNSIDAINAADSGSREIIIAVDKPDESTLEVVWEDSGIGIDKEKYEKIFQPFYTEKAETGSGLGLSMIKNIVSKYKGTIEVDSIKGKYTKFRLVFNLA